MSHHSPLARNGPLLAAAGTLVFLVWLAGAASAQTNVPAGPLPANDTWTAAGSPYVIGGEVVVPAGLRLQLSGGAVVEAGPSGLLTVQGQLDAVGTAASPIEFRPDAGNTSWGGIQATGAGRVQLRNVTFTSPSTAVRAASSGALNMSDVRVVGALSAGIFFDSPAGAATLVNVAIGANGWGVRAVGYGGPWRADNLSVDGPGICLLMTDSGNATITNLRLSGCTSEGLRLESTTNITAANVTIGAGGTGFNESLSTGLRLSLFNITAPKFCADLANGSGNWILGLVAIGCERALVTQGAERDLRVERLIAGEGISVLFYGGTNLTLRDSALTGAGPGGISNRWVVPPPPPPMPPAMPTPAVIRYGTPTGVHLANVTVDGRSWAIEFQGASGLDFRALVISRAVNAALWLRNVADIVVNGSDLNGVTQSVYGENISNFTLETSTVITAGGTGLLCSPCFNPLIRENTFSGNSLGVRLGAGSGGVVTRNLFLYNAQHATTNTSAHLWDDGAIGNLWDDYTGVDANSDGIGDTPYPVGGGLAVDRYPIMRYPDSIPPLADAGPDFIVYEDSPVWFNGYRCSDNVAIRLYLWSSNDPLANFTVEGYDAMTTFPTPGAYEVTLTVIDWGGNRAQDTVKVYVLDRTPPVAHAGGNRTVDEDFLVIFDGSNSTDNDPSFPENAVFLWTVSETAGARVVYGLHAPYTFAEPGNFTVTLVVRDAAGLSSQERFYVNVNDRTPPVLGPIYPPVAFEKTPFRVYAAPSTDNDPLWPIGKTEWFQLFVGSQLLFYTPDSPAVFNVSEPGVYTVWYFVADASDNVASIDVTFLVGDATPPNLSAIADRTVELGAPITFDLTGVTDNDATFADTATAQWTIPVPSGRIVLDGRSVNFTFASRGRSLIWAEVADQAGNLARKSFLVTVVDTEPPALDATGPLTVEAGTQATYLAQAHDPSGIGAFSWNVTGLSTVRWGAVLEYRFPAPGHYTLRVHVDDLLGQGVNATLNVTVTDATPPRIELACAPGRNCVGVRLTAPDTLSVAFVGEDAVPGVSVNWDFGDGSASAQFIGSHLYAVPGNYTVTVRAVDAAGNANATTFMVEVDAPAGTGPGETPGNTTSHPTGGFEFPVVAMAALVAVGVAAGTVIGFRAGRAKHPREHIPKGRGLPPRRP